MSLVETLQAAHKARVARIAARAVGAAQKPIAQATPEPAPEPEAVPPSLTVLDYTMPGGPVRMERILRIVSERFGLSVMDLISARRTADLIMPRHIIYYLCKRLTLHSLPAIGRRLGGRDHVTIRYGALKIERMIGEDAGLHALVTELADLIGGSDQTALRKPRKRLTEQQVKEIRASDDSLVNLAKRYNVTHGAIWHVRNFRTWAHLNEQSGGETQF